MHEMKPIEGGALGKATNALANLEATLLTVQKQLDMLNAFNGGVAKFCDANEDLVNRLSSVVHLAEIIGRWEKWKAENVP